MAAGAFRRRGPGLNVRRRAEVPPDGSSPRQGHPALPLVLAAAVAVTGFADLVGAEKQHLRHALVGVDLRRQGGGVGKLQGHVPFPLRLQRRDVDDDAATGIGALAQADHQHIARNAEVFHRPRQGEGVGRNHAALALEVDEALRIEGLVIDDGGIDVGEDLELVFAAHVVAVAGDAIADDAVVAAAAHLAGGVGLDHAVLLRHAADPSVCLDAHRSGLYWNGRPDYRSSQRFVRITWQPRRRYPPLSETAPAARSASLPVTPVASRGRCVEEAVAGLRASQSSLTAMLGKPMFAASP